MDKQPDEIDLIKLLKLLLELFKKHKWVLALIFVFSFSFAVYQKLNEEPVFYYELVVQSEGLEPMAAHDLMFPVGEALRKQEFDLAKKILGTSFTGINHIKRVKVEPLVTTKTYKKSPILNPDTVYYSKLIVKSNKQVNTDTLQKVLVDVWLQSNLLKAERSSFASVYRYQQQLIKEKKEADSLIRVATNNEDKAWYFKKSLMSAEFLVEVDKQISMFGEGLLVVKPFSPNVIQEPQKSWALYCLMATFSAFVFFGLYIFFFELFVKLRKP